jgi:peroxiredoxin
VQKSVAPDIEDLTPLRAGDEAPFGTLITADGKAVDSENFIRGNPTLFIFYQGYWSIEADTQMDQWIKLVPRLTAMGYQVAAITPDKPEKLKETLAKHPINYTLFFDKSMDVTRRFGLAYHADRKLYQKMNVDLNAYTEDHLGTLPLPAVYGINRKGIVRFFYLDPDENLLRHPENLLKTASDMLAE